MNGMALGFYEETTNGHRIIGHAGDTQYLHSDLHLILDARVGLFLSYNSAGKSGTRAREPVRHAFLDRYCPYEPAPVSAVDGARDAQLHSDRSIISRSSETTRLQVLTLLRESIVCTNHVATISL